MDLKGSHSMYKMRPVIKLEDEIELPKCMYGMKVIQMSHSIVDLQKNESDLQLRTEVKESNPEIDALEDRQEAILVQLLHLKQQLHSLREQLKNSQENYFTPQVCSSDKLGLLDEVVVKANPNSPPYSILALDNMLENVMNIRCCVHSGTDCVLDSLKYFERKSVSPLFNILIVWKMTQETEFLVSPTKHCAIGAEVNLLRFLSRSGPLPFNYDSPDKPATACVADDLLDSCHRLTKERSVKATRSLLHTFAAHLSKQMFFMGNAVSIVDIALWSCLKQLNIHTKSAEMVPPNINKWFINCSKIFGANIP